MTDASTDLAALLEQGTQLDADGKFDDAESAFRTATAAAPENPEAWRRLGDSLAALTRFDDALQAYRTATKFAPDDPALATRLAQVHLAQGELNLANTERSETHRAEHGEVVQLGVGEVRGLPFCCRFFATAERRDALEDAAKRLMDFIVPAVHEVPGFPMRPEQGMFVVERPGVRLICDVDEARPKRWSRFFDATRLVGRVADGEIKVELPKAR